MMSAGRSSYQLEVALAHPDGVEWTALAVDLLADGDRMERLVADLLFLAREDATHSEPSRDPIDLDVVILEEVARLRACGTVTVDTSAVSGAATRGMSHARSRVAISLSETSTGVRMVVSDDGPGVPEGHQDRIFDRFARVEGSRVRGAGGTGLGLSIARAIAERHGGSISLQGGHQAPGDGARFLVLLPNAGWRSATGVSAG